MQDGKKQPIDAAPTQQLLVHRAATASAQRCCDYRVLMGDRLAAPARQRCLHNETGGCCVAPPRIGRRVSA